MKDELRFFGGAFLGMGIASHGGPQVACYAIALVATLWLAAITRADA